MLVVVVNAPSYFRPVVGWFAVLIKIELGHLLLVTRYDSRKLFFSSKFCAKLFIRSVHARKYRDVYLRARVYFSRVCIYICIHVHVCCVSRVRLNRYELVETSAPNFADVLRHSRR